MNRLIALVLAITVIFPSVAIVSNYEGSSTFSFSFQRNAYIKAGEGFYIHFNESSGIEFSHANFNLTSMERKAVARAPEWIRLRLAKQFELIDGNEYARLILNAPWFMTDEIAFSVATCPTNAMPSPQLLYDNAYYIYENAKYIDYAKLIELPNGSTTIEYRMIENGSVFNITAPLSIYYWYVVHPRITFEDASYIYGRFWRDYLFNHNDIGYPLLKEKLHGIKYLWDGCSYHPPAHRTWKWSMENHPTAVEAVNYWVGKTVNQYATGDRPGQPNTIAHEHNGFCGEIQQISAAAQRAALIPSVGINDMGEDHVWREFWAGGWQECDNWWADGGGSVANYGEYRYGWHKIMSALFAWKGDSSIYDVTPKYIHEEDRGKVVVKVVDLLGRPVDGARVLVLGSWKANNFKNKLWDKSVGRIWSILPERIKEKWKNDYDRIRQFYRDYVPGIVPWIWPSIWNYTDMNGEASFNLGYGHSYLFLINKDEVFYYGPFTMGKSNGMKYYITLLPKTRYAKIRFILPDGRNIMHEPSVVSGDGKYAFSLSFNAKALQHQRNPWDWVYGMSETGANVHVMVMDEENFERYRNGESFVCMNYANGDNGNIKFNATDCYIVFKNDGKRSDVSISIKMKIEGKGDFINIDMPSSDALNEPVMNAGVIKLHGFSSGEGIVKIENKTWNVYGNFTLEYELSPGRYTVHAECGEMKKDYIIDVEDISPPGIVIEKPYNGELIDGNSMEIKGRIEDNTGIKEAYAYLNGEKIPLEEDFDKFVELSAGDYNLSIYAMDDYGNKAFKNISITVGGANEKPAIGKVYHTPSNPNSSSNVVIYAFVNKTFYNIKNVTAVVNGKEIKMWRYSYPYQPRHNEDALKNESNTPRYGVELSQLKPGKYTFYIKAIDTAGNIAISEEKEFTVS